MPDSHQHDEADIVLAATGGMPALDADIEIDVETEIEMAATKNVRFARVVSMRSGPASR